MRKKLASLIVVIVLVASTGTAAPRNKKKNCVSPSRAAQFLHAATQSQQKLRSAAAPLVQTAGNIVVLEADPEILIVPNPFDLKRDAIRFTPALRTRYLYSRIPYSYNAEASDTIVLRDDDSKELVFRNFEFPFGGKSYSRCFVNSNGNLTFDQGDVEPPDLETLLAGPPRIAPFFADLDPESSGTVFVQQTSDMVIISWLKVPEFFNNEQFAYGQNTFQVVLHSDGRIDLIYSDEMTASQALIGIVAGYGKSQLRLVDFTRTSSKPRPSRTVVENFRNYESIDIPQVMKSLYKNAKDDFEFVTLLSNFDLTPLPGAQAFALNVQNDVKGIGSPGRGKPLFRDTERYGSAGKLQNVTFLGNIHQYPTDPNQAMPDTYTSLLQILAHEVGHRWLSYVKITTDGARSDLLLGRDKSHWSFFLDSEGSFLEGNQIVQKSANSFATFRPYTGFSSLDLYLMGLLPASEVKPSFVVTGANGFSPSFEFAAESAPEPDVTFRGAARPVTVDEVIAANGSRKPDASSSQKTFRHLFVLIVKKSAPASDQDVAAVDLLRTSWEAYFTAVTAGRGRMLTHVE